MALTPDQFTGAAGNLRDWMFPGEDLALLLDGWIADAEARVAVALAADADLVLTASGAAARAWVLHRAYSNRCEAAGSPDGRAVASVSVEGKGSVSYRDDSKTAPDYCALAARYRAQAGLLASVYDEVDAAGPIVWCL